MVNICGAVGLFCLFVYFFFNPRSNFIIKPAAVTNRNNLVFIKQHV